MFKIEKYIDDLICGLQKNFKDRLLYVGLQGSYMRGEAKDNSDIDIMSIIDSLTLFDLDSYKKTLISVGNYDKSCGFICGREELLKWNPLEICHLSHTTKDCFGKLEDFVPRYTNADVKNHVKLSLGNLYHELCHRYVHSDTSGIAAAFPAVFKSLFFILQNIYYLRTGCFANTKKELLCLLDDEDKEILKQQCLLNQNTIIVLTMYFQGYSTGLKTH